MGFYDFSHLCYWKKKIPHHDILHLSKHKKKLDCCASDIGLCVFSGKKLLPAFTLYISGAGSQLEPPA